MSIKKKFVPPATLPPTFREGWNEVRTKYAPPDPNAQPYIMAEVARRAVKWVREDLQPGVRPELRSFSECDIYAQALTLGAFCLYAGWRKTMPFLITMDKRMAELPLMSEFPAGAASNSVYKLNVSHASSGIETWTHFNGGGVDWALPGGGGPGTGHLIHAGLHILGAATQMPPKSMLAVHDVDAPAPNHITPIALGIPLGGLPSFPHDISFTPPPGQQ